MNAGARRVQRVYLVLLRHTLAASFIWGINTLFLLDVLAHIAVRVLGCACRSTDTYARLEGRWGAGERDLGDDVLAARLYQRLPESSLHP